MTTKYLYVLAAKSIQTYILSCNKLRMMVGASNLVEGLATDFIPTLLKKLGLLENNDYDILSTAAGGIRVIFHDKDKAESLLKIVPFAVSIYAPGLEISQAIAPIEKDNLAHAFEKANSLLRMRRNIIYPELPVANPMVKRVPTTGQPAIDTCDGDFCDAEMLAKYQSADRKTLAGKLHRDDVEFVDDFAQLVSGERSLMALVHIDGNGLGRAIIEKIKQLPAGDVTQAASEYKRICKEIDDLVTNSVKNSLPGNIHCRPLVCAGDDVTIVLPAVEAFEFVQRFFRSLNNRLTASAGIVYCKHNYPILQAYELCESLVKYAKKKLERKKSGVAFWRLTASVARDFETIVKEELTTSYGLALTQMPYAVDEMDQLRNLAEAIDKNLPRGSVRKLVAEYYRGNNEAERLYNRMREVAEQGAWEKFEEALHPLERQGATPLYDALELLAAQS